MKLGVNIDHIAVLREARGVNDPDILNGLFTAVEAGADQITIHLREDRRHINEIDARNIISLSHIPVNLECSINKEIIDLVCEFKPLRATLVPERREELTTEGGLNLAIAGLSEAIAKLNNAGVEVSLFIDPSKENVELSKNLGASFVEFHTGAYSNAFLALNSNISNTKYAVYDKNFSRKELKEILNNEFKVLEDSAKFGASLGLKIAAGHGLNYQNVSKICEIKEIEELNIGQSIIARSIFKGLANSIKDMKELIRR